MTTEITSETIRQRIQDYLENGGLFNPEMMEHNKVRDLLMDCRALISRATETCEWRRLAEIQNALIGELSFETECHCIEAYTARGRHEPNSLCHYHADVLAVRAEYKRLAEKKHDNPAPVKEE